ncbi:MAG: PPC domain-containing protein [Anaerolineae bacterium]|jgi:hypothetical protein|nr:PPC domain-containing protein [Anaerolineae bacterium]
MLRKLLLVMLVLLFSVLIVHAQDTIDFGDSVDGELEANETIDYTFEAEEGTFVVVGLESDDFDPFLTILDDSGDIVANDDDGGEGTNSMVRFVVPENGEYTAQVSSLFGGSGDFTLSLDTGELATIAAGETVEVEFDGETDGFYFSYEGTQGETISISGVSDGSIDTSLVLFGPDGFEIERDDDSGENTDPLITTAILPQDGMYLIQLVPYAGPSAEGVVAVTVEAVELTSLDGGEPQEVDLFETSEAFFAFTAEEGTTYRLTFTAGGDASVFNEITVDGESVATNSFSGVSQATFDFTVEDSGAGLIRITGFFFDEETLEVSLTPVE